MWKSSSALGGAQGFTISVTKQEDGSYKAFSTSQTEIPAAIAPTEAEAVQEIKKALQTALMSGRTT